MKKTMALFLALMMCVTLLAACGGSSTKSAVSEPTAVSETASKTGGSEAAGHASTTSGGGGKNVSDLNLVYVTPLLASEVWLVSKEGFDAAEEEMGFTGNWVGPANLDVDAMIKQIEIAIAEDVDGIITCGLNPEAMVPVMEQADAAGIPVVLVNAGSTMDAPFFAYIGTEGEELGSIAAEAVLDRLGDEAPHVIYMGSSITNSSVLDTTSGYKSVFEGVKGYEDLSLEENDDDLNKSVELWQQLFITYPDVNVAACVAPSGAVGAAQVAKEMGIEDLIIMGIDDTPEVLEGIREGNIYGTMSQNYYRMGYIAAKWLVDYNVEGTQPPTKINDSGTLLINQDNIDTFQEELRNKDAWK
ncbi:MAG: substrate-binding domain-containing protein [Fastidiosipilaceae bacterium]